MSIFVLSQAPNGRALCASRRGDQQDVRSNVVIRQYLCSEKHRKSVVDLNSAGRSVREGVEHSQKRVMCTENICQTLIDR